MGKGEGCEGYYCLLIAIFCNVSADEARLLYWHGPEHPVCRKILAKRLPLEDVGDDVGMHFGKEQPPVTDRQGGN